MCLLIFSTWKSLFAICHHPLECVIEHVLEFLWEYILFATVRNIFHVKLLQSIVYTLMCFFSAILFWEWGDAYIFYGNPLPDFSFDDDMLNIKRTKS